LQAFGDSIFRAQLRAQRRTIHFADLSNARLRHRAIIRQFRAWTLRLLQARFVVANPLFILKISSPITRRFLSSSCVKRRT
jgi:hypothetical protein